MRDMLNKYRPATSWITTGLLTLVVTTFGFFAQSHTGERDTNFAEVSSSISSHALQLVSVCRDNANTVSSNIHYR